MLGRCLLALALAVAASSGAALAAPAYVRHPDLHQDRVVFTAEGDLWLLSVSGGAPRRLTSHPGDEAHAKFSPDGRSIAYTGQYDGNADVFVVAAEGGEPQRLTWHPANEVVLGWTPDGRSILFRSSAEYPHGNNEIFALPVDGGDARKLPIGWAERLEVDPASGRWAVVRSSWESATWKRYRGGTAPDIWVGHPDRGDFRRVTDFPGSDAFPMWHDGRIVFLSDQGGTANLWTMSPDGTDRRQLTTLSEWDVRWPAMGDDGRVVFTAGADLHVVDPSGATRRIMVDLPSDRVLTRVRYPNADRSITWFDLSPDGTRLAVTSRGEIFSVPVKKGVTLPISRGSGARESWASFSADGERVVYVTDESGEEELRVVDAWRRSEPRTVVPPGGGRWYFPPAFSPDGRRVAYADQTQTLWVARVDGGAPVRVDRGERSEIRQYAWSPDGRWLAYARSTANDYTNLFLWDSVSSTVTRLTGPFTHDDSPAWDPEGRYLYFASERVTNPVLGSRDWDNVEAKNRKLYAILLRRDVRDPSLDLAGLPGEEPDEAEEQEEGEDEKKPEGKEKKRGRKNDDRESATAARDKKAKEPPKPVVIELDGIADRVVELAAPIGVYSGLAATADTLFFLSHPVQGFAEQPGLFQDAPPDATLMAYDVEDRKAQPFVEGVSAYSLATEGAKLAVAKRPGEIHVVDTAAPPGEKLAEGKVALGDMVLEIDPREEWRQIFFEAWRLQRDFFWDEGMGSLDWKAVRDHYAALLPRVASRADLQDLLGEIIGELGNSHTYVFGGDPGRELPRVGTGLLGADLERDGAGYRITRIYRGDPADNVVSPLLRAGAGIREGDRIVAVNHQPFRSDRPFHAALEGLADRMVVLTIASGSGATRDVAVRTLGSDGELRYHDWVRRTREYVAQKTGGTIGYLHVPDMWKSGLIAFNTWFYPQLDKQGMIVDARWNGGGAVSQMLIQRLKRRLISFDRSRSGTISTYPYRVLNGPFVVLTNEFAGSDGDIFPAVVQMEKLAPVIGMRSWGGVVGIRGDKRLVDGGMVTAPEFAWWDAQSGWDLENRGVVPDIEVQNAPQDVARGVDAQLDRAIAEVLRLREQHPPLVPTFGPVRDRSRGGFQEELPKGQ